MLEFVVRVTQMYSVFFPSSNTDLFVLFVNLRMLFLIVAKVSEGQDCFMASTTMCWSDKSVFIVS